MPRVQWDRKANQPTKIMSNTNKPQYTDFDLGPHSYDLYAWGLEPVAQLNNQNHSQGEWVNIEDYRKLERERNDARDTKWAREIHSCHNECARPMCVLRRERDEARRDVRDLMEKYQDSLRYGDEFEDSEIIEGICDRLSDWETKPNL